MWVVSGIAAHLPDPPLNCHLWNGHSIQSFTTFPPTRLAPIWEQCSSIKTGLPELLRQATKSCPNNLTATGFWVSFLEESTIYHPAAKFKSFSTTLLVNE